MENKMSEVAKLLGVELDEVFYLADRKMGYERIRCKYKLTNIGLERKYLFEGATWASSALLLDILTGRYKVIKSDTSILDDAEKRYLSAVIKPFKNKVYAIAKYDDGDDNYYIQIMVKQNVYFEYIDFPYFKKGTMYKGMELKKEYTVEQLGL